MVPVAKQLDNDSQKFHLSIMFTTTIEENGEPFLYLDISNSEL